MTSPKTRRVLSELRAKDENDVRYKHTAITYLPIYSKIKVRGLKGPKIPSPYTAVVPLILFFLLLCRDALNVEHTILNGLVLRTVFGYV